MQDKEAAPDRVKDIQQFDWKQPNFNWQGLTIDQKNAILNNPEFDIKDVPTSQQGMIISDPTFDFMGKIASGKLPWWQAPAFYGLSSPYTAPLAQGVIMGAPIALQNPVAGVLTGGAIAALGYGANIKGPVGDAARTLGQWLMKGATTTEQVAGTIPQVAEPVGEAATKELNKLTGAVPAPGQKHSTPTLDQVQKAGGWGPYIRAAWEAAKTTYTTGYLTDTIAKEFEPETQKTVWVLGDGKPVPVQPGYTTDDARERIINGEAPDSVVADFAHQYGVSGQASQLLLYALIDPLRVLPEAVGEVHARISDAAAEEALAAGNPARAQIESMKADAYRAAPGLEGIAKVGPIESQAARVFRSLSSTQSEVPTADLVAEMTPHERSIAGLTPEGKIAELAPAVAGAKPNIVQLMTTLTPEAKAIISAHMVKENMGVLLDWAGQGSDAPQRINQVLRLAAGSDMQGVRDMGAAFMDNPEVYTHIGALRDFQPTLDELTANYQLAESNRELFWKVQQITGMDPQTLLKNFTDGDPTPDFNNLVEQARASKDPAAQEFVKQVDAGLVDPQKLAQQFEVFKDGSVPIHVQEFKAQVLNKLYEHMGNWAVNAFGVQKTGDFLAALQLMKGAQSMLMLDYNPAYLVHKFLNDRVLMAANGVLGLTPHSEINDWMDEFGVTPARIQEGFGPADEGQQTTPADNIIRDAASQRGADGKSGECG